MKLLYHEYSFVGRCVMLDEYDTLGNPIKDLLQKFHVGTCYYSSFCVIRKSLYNLLNYNFPTNELKSNI